MTSDEGGLIEEEYLNLYIVDRVATTGTTWLGLTVACAQCHDHKYDPITQRDYYQIYAFFHNVPESGKDGVRDRNPKPFPDGPERRADSALEKTQRRDRASSKRRSREMPSRSSMREQAEWEKQVAASGPLQEPAGPFAVFPLDADGTGRDEDGQGDRRKTAQATATFVDGAIGNAFRVEGERATSKPANVFGFEKDQAFTAGAWLRLKPAGGAPFGKMEVAPDFRGWDLEIQAGKPTVHLIHTWPENAHPGHGRTTRCRWTPFCIVAFSYDGSGKAAGVKIYVNGRAVKTKVVKDKLSGHDRDRRRLSASGCAAA